MTRLELLGCYAIVAAVLVVVALLAWQLLRPSKVPQRWTAAPGNLVEVFDGKQLLGIDDIGPAVAIPVDGDPRDVAFHMERPEPVRESFRRMLEGGPDYYHQEAR